MQVMDVPGAGGRGTRWWHWSEPSCIPSVPSLPQVLPLLRALGATGLLLEYEDTFPYTGSLELLRAPHAYRYGHVPRRQLWVPAVPRAVPRRH